MQNQFFDDGEIIILARTCISLVHGEGRKVEWIPVRALIAYSIRINEFCDMLNYLIDDVKRSETKKFFALARNDFPLLITKTFAV